MRSVVYIDKNIISNFQSFKMSRNLSLARYIYKKSLRNRSTAFCKCNQENAELCVCGENDSRILNWKWDNENSSDAPTLVIDGQNVTFHPIFSQGTVSVIISLRSLCF